MPASLPAPACAAARSEVGTGEGTERALFTGAGRSTPGLATSADRVTDAILRMACPSKWGGKASITEYGHLVSQQ